MLRYVRLRSSPTIGYITQTTRCFATRRPEEADEEDIPAARQWLAKLDADTIRNNAICDVSFSRSSGPGGQNVNKYDISANHADPELIID
jgi:peptidyl-tRNA hydrolase ICT1